MRKLLSVLGGATLAIGLSGTPVSAASETASSDKPIIIMRDGRHGGHGDYGRRHRRHDRRYHRDPYYDRYYYGDPYYDRYYYGDPYYDGYCYEGRDPYYGDRCGYYGGYQSPERSPQGSQPRPAPDQNAQPAPDQNAEPAPEQGRQPY